MQRLALLEHALVDDGAARAARSGSRASSGPRAALITVSATAGAAARFAAAVWVARPADAAAACFTAGVFGEWLGVFADGEPPPPMPSAAKRRDGRADDEEDHQRAQEAAPRAMRRDERLAARAADPPRRARSACCTRRRRGCRPGRGTRRTCAGSPSCTPRREGTPSAPPRARSGTRSRMRMPFCTSAAESPRRVRASRRLSPIANIAAVLTIVNQSVEKRDPSVEALGKREEIRWRTPFPLRTRRKPRLRSRPARVRRRGAGARVRARRDLRRARCPRSRASRAGSR